MEKYERSEDCIYLGQLFLFGGLRSWAED